MRIKIGDQSVPTMVTPDDGDRTNIANTDPCATEYTVFPDDFSSEAEEEEECLDWLRVRTERASDPGVYACVMRGVRTTRSAPDRQCTGCGC